MNWSFLIFMSFQFVWAGQNNQQMNSIQICEQFMPEIYDHIKGPCKWEYIDESKKDFCSIECGHDDPGLQGFPFRLDKVYCYSSAEYCTKNFQSCIDAQKKNDVESCKNINLKETWHREPGDPPDRPVNQSQ